SPMTHSRPSARPCSKTARSIGARSSSSPSRSRTSPSAPTASRATPAWHRRPEPPTSRSWKRSGSPPRCVPEGPTPTRRWRWTRHTDTATATEPVTASGPAGTDSATPSSLRRGPYRPLTWSLAVDGFGAGLFGVLDVGDDLVRLQPSPHADGEDDGGDDEAGQLAPTEGEQSQAAITIVSEEAQHGQTADPQQRPPAGRELQRRDLAAVAERVVQTEPDIAECHGQEQLPVRVPTGPEHDEVGGEEAEERQRITAGQTEGAFLIRQLTSQR